MNREQTTISFDALVALAVTEANQRELAQLPSAAEMEAEFQPSARLEKEMERTLHRCRGAKRRQTALRWLRRGAMAAAALWVVFTGALVPVQAVQQATYSTLLEWKDKFTSLIISSDTKTAAFLPENIQVTYLPEGYIPESKKQTSHTLINCYKNDSGQNLLLQITSIPQTQQIDLDNEYSEYYTVQFDDSSALWIQNESDITMIVYERDDLLFYISGSVDLSQLIEIARGIQY